MNIHLDLKATDKVIQREADELIFHPIALPDADNLRVSSYHLATEVTLTLDRSKIGEELNMKIHLDNCCFNHPFDDQTQSRIKLEAEAKLKIQEEVRSGNIQLVLEVLS